ncbi:PKD-like domain-containing protein, partial [Lacihabitans soyangensis]
MQILLERNFTNLFKNRITFAIILAWGFFVFGHAVAKENLSRVKSYIPAPPINFSGQIAGDQINNGPFDPALITSVSAATTTNGTIEYRWQSSTNGTTWTDIAGTNSQTYNPGPITVTTYYRRLVRSQTAGFEATSNVISKVVTNYTITTPVVITAGNTLNLNQTGSFPNLLLDELPNGSFTNGNSGFSSDVPLGNVEGRYNIGDRPIDIFGSSYENFYDRFGRGELFAVTAPGTVGQRMWFTTISIVAGNTYDLSAWVRSFNSGGTPSTLRWFLDNNPLGTGNLTAPAGTWAELATTFTATTTGSVVISVRNFTAGSTGNNFAMDDMTVYEHTPVTYLWTGPNGFTSNLPNPSIPNAQAINSGTYTLTVTKNGYSVSISKVITVDATPVVCLPPAVAVTRTNVSCFGQNNGTITATGTLGNGGLGNITYQYWDNLSGSAVSNLTNTTTNPDYPNSPDGNFLISRTKAPSNFLDNYGSRMIGYLVPRETGTYYFWISSDDDSQLWIGTTSDPSSRVLRANVSGFTNEEEWNKFPSQRSVAITLTAGQIYYLEILHKEGGGGDNLAVGWSKPGQPTVVPSEILPSSVLRPFTPSSLTIPVYTYSINGGAFQSSGVFSNLAAGNYTVTLQDSYGCTATNTITITQPASFSSTPNSNLTVCQGASINLTATNVSGGSYSWAGPNGFSSSSQNPSISNASTAAAGIYTLSVTVSGCTNTYTTNISVVANPVVTRTFVNPNCGFNDGSITFDITDDPSQTQISLSIDGGTTYPYTVNDNIGTYTIPNLPAGIYNLRARWTSGTQCPIVLPSVTLAHNGQLRGLTMSPNITACAQISVPISGSTTQGVAPYTFLWTGGGSLPNTSTITVNPNSTRTYTLTVTDNAGCTATGNVTVNIVSSPTVNITSVDSLICVNGSSTITSSLNVQGTYSYQWYSSTNGTSWNFLSGATGPTLTQSFLLPGNNNFYRLEVDGAGGSCSPGTSNTFRIRVVPAPTATVVAASNVTCIGTPSRITANVSNGTGSISFQWQQSLDGSTGWYDVGVNSINYTPDFGVAGVFYYRVIATMSGVGCSYAVSPSFTYTVVNPGVVTTTPVSSQVCLNAILPLNTSVTSVSGTHSLQWQEGSSPSVWWNLTGATNAIYNITNDTLGLRYYRAVVNFSSCGLFYPAPVQIQTNDFPVVTATITNQPVCINGNTQLQGVVSNMTGTASYQWERRSSLSDPWSDAPGATSLNFNPPTNSSGTVYYRLRVNSTALNCGPQYSESITLNIVPQTTVTIAPSNPIICLNGVYTLNSSINNGVGPFTYQWQVSTTGSAGTFSNVASGGNSDTYVIPTVTENTRYYKVIVNASGNGCLPAESNVQMITVLPRPTLSVTNTGVHCIGSVFKLTATPSPTTPTPITGYSWSSANGFTSTQQSPLVLVSSAAMGGVYTVTATGANQCTNTATTNMTIDTNCDDICTGQFVIVPTNPGACTTNTGSVSITTSNAIQTSLNGVNWNTGNFSYTNMSVGNSLFFVRDVASGTVCKNVNITLVSTTSTFFTGQTVTPANGCYSATGAIQLNGVNPTDQVSWMATLGTTSVPVSSLSPANTITGLIPGTYYVKVSRNGEYCYSERYVVVPNSGTPCNPSATCDDALSPNLFPNGDFGSGASENGPVYVDTQYGYSTYTCFAPWDGFYSITNNTNCGGPNGGQSFSTTQATGWWRVLTEDHTPGDVNGYMMVVNAGYTPNIVVEKFINNLCPNTQYNFTAWLRNISPESTIKPNVSFIIDGVIRASSGEVLDDWQQVGFSFKTGASTTSALFAIRNLAPGGFGNNFIIDDIKVSKCPLNISLNAQSVACLGGTNETISATIADPYGEYDFYKWEESNDNGVTWTQTTAPAQGTYSGGVMNVSVNLPTPIVSALSGKLYRIRLSTTLGTINDPGCSVTSQITQIIVPPVTVTVTPPVTICNGSSASLTAVGGGGTSPYTYTWTNTTATGGTVSVSPTTTTNYTVTARDVDNCSATATTQVIVTPLPVASATGQTICTGTAFSVAPTSNIPGTQYRWTVAQISGTSSGHTNQTTSVSGPISQTLTNTTAVDAVVRYTVTPYNGICPGASFTFDVTVRPTITIINPGNQTICSGNAFSRTPTSNITGTNYTWTAAITSAPTSGTITGFTNNTVASAAPITQTLTNTGTTNGVVTYTVTPVANGCNGVPFTFAITVQPTIAIINPGPQTICSGTAFSRTPNSNIIGTTYTWTVAVTTAPTGGSITGSSNNSTASSAPISQTLTNSGTTNGVLTYTVTPIANGCNGTPFSFDITVQPTITITNPGPQTICSGSSFSRTPTSNIAGTTYTWTAAITTSPTAGTITGHSDNLVGANAPISQTLTNNGSSNGIVTYTITPVTAGCNGTPFTIAITVLPTITFSTVSIPSICSGGNPAAVTPTVNNTSGGTNTFTWTLQGTLPAGVTMSATTGTGANVDLPVINNTTNANVTLTFNLTGTNSANNCPINATTFT